MAIDYAAARQLLDETLAEVVQDVLAQRPAPTLSQTVADACEVVFASSTQAYREALLGCVLARIQDSSIDVHKPYVNHGEDAYNGRTLDERTINPFFHDNRIPSSRGPFLSTFRRSVTFEPATRSGLRDRGGFDAMLVCVDFVATSSPEALRQFLRYLMHRFVELREAASVPLTRVQRFSLRQLSALVSRLLSVGSGGRFPVFIVVAAFRAISHRFQLDWHIDHQGINVADGASGAGGDITIHRNGELLMAAEVTERSVNRDRVVSTFNTKIGPNGISDYLFFVTQPPGELAKQQCQMYFAQGHEVSFLEITAWLEAMLATIGRIGREEFLRELLTLIDASETPQSVRASWNAAVNEVIGLA